MMNPALLGPLATLVCFLALLIIGILLTPKRPDTFLGMKIEYRDDIPPGEIWLIDKRYFQSPVLLDEVRYHAGVIRNVR